MNWKSECQAEAYCNVYLVNQCGNTYVTDLAVL